LKRKSLVLIVILLSGIVVFFLTFKKEETPERALTVGLDAPEVALGDTSGKRYTLAELRGSVVFINFWASWCQPCIEEMPSIQAIYGRFRGDNRFRMLSVLYRDDYGKAIDYLKGKQYDFPVLTDIGGMTAKAYGVTGVPETYIVDKKGVLREKVIGPADWSSPQAVSLITNLLNE